jgi:primosomal protein N' (replication factor Y)
MNVKLADVAIPVPLPQLFTYIIPSHLESIAQQGSMVVVPFRKKILTGVIINFRTERPNVTLKNIIDIIDLTPTLSHNDIKLAEWIAEYYNTPLGETIKLFLPAGFSQTSKRIVSLSDLFNRNQSLFSTKSKIVQLLSNKSATIIQLRKKSGLKNIYAVVNKLVSEGVVTISEEVTKKPSIRMERFFGRLSNDPTLKFRSVKQQETWSAILSMDQEEIHAASFLKETSSSLSTLKNFEQKKLIKFRLKKLEQSNSFVIDEHLSKSLSIQLNNYQKEAVQSISTALSDNSSQTFLLYGITGSGKTQVYIESIRKTLEQNKTAFVLIPEISLTPQTVKRFQVHFGDQVIWMHSRLSDSERYDAWRLAQSGKYKIVIGPRSALFAPLKNIGLIIVDEEHESSYKQYDSSPRYNARDVAIVRAALNNAVVILGSATPSIESYSNALNDKYTLLTLPERADNAVLPPVTIVNMIEERKQLYAEAKIHSKEIGKKAFENLSHSISRLLELKIRDRLEKKEGIILLQNRRGFAPFIECKSCGYVEQCDRCNVTMTYHATKKHMRCHYCGKVKPAPTSCSKCSGFEFALNGFGTQRVEQELAALFPTAVTARMDMDTTTRKGSHEKILRQFGEGGTDILLGTQMVAKGLDFPHVTLVGVISADTQMMLPDFRSAERTFQLLTQVAGRAGRSTLAGEVIIQTSQANHYALKHVQEHDFVGFYNEEIEFRKSLSYPPFSRVVVVEFKGKSEKNVEHIASGFGKQLFMLLNRDSILGPSPAVLSKIKNEYRWQIIIKADKENDKNGTRARHSVARVVNELLSQSTKSKVKINVDVDPAGIL